MQPNFSTLKPVEGQPNFGALKPVQSASSSPLDGFANANQSVIGAGLQAGKEALGNLPGSAYQFGKGTYQAAKGLFTGETEKGVYNLLGGAGQTALNKIYSGVLPEVQNKQTQTFDAFTQMLKDRYGSLENLQKTATQDPFGFGADVLSVLEGGAGLLGKTEQLNTALSKTAGVVTKPISATAGKIGDVTSATTKFGVSQATGLNPETITELIKNPQKFKEINPELRAQTATQVANSLDERLSELSDMGKGYEQIRQAQSPVNIPEGTISKVLNKYGVKLDENRQIVTSPESRPLSVADRSALQDFINNYGIEGQTTSNPFLNVREALSNLSKYEQGKTSLPTQIARDLRSEYDAVGKAQIPGLKELDTAYAPERQLLSQLKNDIFTPAGDLKDGAISKIANITGKGKENFLNRMKQVVPDIEERVKVIKAIEDIEKASGFKVGTYTRGGVIGAGLVTGNVPAIIGAILAQPEIAVPLLKGAGYAGQKARPILEAIKTMANDINNFRLPKQVLDYVENPKLGASIQRVGQNEDKIAKQLLSLDTSVPTVNGKPALDSMTTNWQRLDELKTKLDTKGLTKAEYAEVDTLLQTTPGAGELKTATSPLIQEAKKYKSAETPLVNFAKKYKSVEGLQNDLPRFDGLADLAKNVRALNINKFPRLSGDEIVTIYRGAHPESKGITAGDWITLDRQTARNYSSNVQELKVRKSDIVNPGIEKGEYIFAPKSIESQLTDIWKKANKK